MSEDLRFVDLGRDSMAEFAFIASLPEGWHDTPVSAETLKIHFTVNGVEMDFRRAMARLDENFDHAVKKAAARLIQERANAVSSLVSLTHDLRRHVREKVRELFPDFEFDEDDWDV